MRRFPLSLVSLALLAFPGCGGPTSPRDRPDVGNGKRLDALAGVLRAEDRRLIDADLLAALSDDSPEVRAAAVRAVARIGAPESGTHLVARLDDPDPVVRAAAAFGLGLLGRAEAVPALISAFDDGDPEVRARTVQALGALADGGAAAVLLRALSDESPGVREEAALAAWRVPEPSSLLDALIAGTSDPEARVRFGSAYALARLASAPSAPPTAGPAPGRLGETDVSRARAVLRTLAGAREPEIRMQAARGLARPATPEEEATLGSLVTDPVPGVRVNVARSLGFEGARIAPHLSRLVRDADPSVARAALEALGSVKTAEAARILVEGLEHERRPWLVEAAVASLVDAYATLARTQIEALASNPDARLRARAASLLARFDDPEAEATARALLRDPVAGVRAAAVPVVARFEPPDGAFWMATLEDEDPVVRAAVATAVGIRWRKAEVDAGVREALWPVLEAAWTRASGDELPDARLEVLASAVSDPKDPRARTLLDSALESGDPVTRRRAADLYHDVFGEDRSAEVGAVSEGSPAEYRGILEWASRPRAAVVTVQRPGFAPGRFVLRLLPGEAPLACRNFARLAESGFFAGLTIHRVVPNFVVQDGDPRGDGFGGPGRTIRDQFGPRRFWAGTVGMATDGPDTGGSQWFVVLSAQPHLDGRYTAFGVVTQNLEGVVARLMPGDRIVRVDVYEGDGSEPLPPTP